MVDPSDRPAVGPYQLTRELPDHQLGARWVALHESDQTSHLVYLIPRLDRPVRERALAALGLIQAFSNPHILRVERFGPDSARRLWVVCPYPGDTDGLLTLGRLLRDKGGQMSQDEAERATLQLLEALEAAHRAGLGNGPILIDDVLVDRHGSLLLELYGVARAVAGDREPATDLGREEVRSIAEIAYQLITGLRAEAPLIPASRLVKKLDPAWAAWLRTALDPLGGFAGPADAISALPSRRPRPEPRRPIVHVRTVLGRLASPAGPDER